MKRLKDNPLVGMVTLSGYNISTCIAPWQHQVVPCCALYFLRQAAEQFVECAGQGLGMAAGGCTDGALTSEMSGHSPTRV